MIKKALIVIPSQLQDQWVKEIFKVRLVKKTFMYIFLLFI